MATINIREEEDKYIDTIVFGEHEERLYEYDSSLIQIRDENYCLAITKSDIDYLIKALQRAKELWT